MKKIYAALLMLIFISSCTKFVQIPNARNQISTQVVFADSADATAALLGIYINMMSTSTTPLFFNGATTINTGMAGDELIPTTGNQLDLQYYTNKLSSNLGDLLWPSAYIWIYQTNAVIEGVAESTAISASWKNQLIGEAKTVRALCYFNLVNLYGPVPLETTTSYQTNATLARSPVDSVYAQIIRDLTDAQNQLGPDYPSAGRVRPNKLAALSLLAKVYLYRQHWSDAEQAASQVISAGTYTLSTDLNEVFLAGSEEAIWQPIPLQPSVETAEGFAFIPGGADVVPGYVISDFLLNAFEPNDQRKLNWLSKNTVNGVDYFYPFKYKLGADGNSEPLEDYMISRLGELYLIRAEARAEQNNITGAAEDLNSIRNRAGLANTTAADQPSMLDSIYHERQTELFCEGANRWYDLKRTGQINTVMSIVTPAKGGGTWKPDWALFPIAYSELSLNPSLKQNPGY